MKEIRSVSEEMEQIAQEGYYITLFNYSGKDRVLLSVEEFILWIKEISKK